MAATRSKRAGLGGAFSAPTPAAHRGEGLGEILGRQKTAPQAPAAGEPSVTPRPALEQAAPARSRTTDSRPRGRARKRNTPIYLTDEVQDALRARALKTGLSYAELAVEAFRSVTRIDELFRPVEVTVEDADEIPAAPVTAADRFPTGTNLVNIRFTDDQREWLDKQWVAKGAASRSMFVATVLAVFLLGDGATGRNGGT